jgi:molybdopterin molybdotransferase
MKETYPQFSVEEAQSAVLERIRVLEAEETPILDALGRVLAEDVYAEYDIPPHSNTAMDGYALRAEDTRGAAAGSPVMLRVVHNLAAGYVSDRAVSQGTAIRIMTGAPLPPGADAVVPFERTEEDGDRVRVFEEQPVGANVRVAGEDVRNGELVLARGAELGPAEIGMLAALGRPVVLAHRRPRVGILATGDEVVAIDAPLGPGQIRNANSYSNAAQVLRYGGIPVPLGIARDNMEAIRDRLRGGLHENIDLLLTSGGVSVGDFDIVKKVLAEEAEMHFWQVRMRPGKPFAFGRIGDVPLLGLPGNPVSAMVSFELFGRPALHRLMGKRHVPHPTVRAVLLDSLDKRKGFRYFVRVRLERLGRGYAARLTGEQGSGILLSMVRADGLAVIPEEYEHYRAGGTVDVLLLDCNVLAGGNA